MKKGIEIEVELPPKLSELEDDLLSKLCELIKLTGAYTLPQAIKRIEKLKEIEWKYKDLCK